MEEIIDLKDNIKTKYPGLDILFQIEEDGQISLYKMGWDNECIYLDTYYDIDKLRTHLNE